MLLFFGTHYSSSRKVIPQEIILILHYMSCIACWRVKLILAIVLQVFCKSVDARTPGKSRSKDCSSGFVEKGTKQDLRRQYLSNWRVMGWANLFISEEDIHITNVYIIWQNTFFVDTVVITIFVLYWNVTCLRILWPIFSVCQRCFYGIKYDFFYFLFLHCFCVSWLF